MKHQIIKQKNCLYDAYFDTKISKISLRAIIIKLLHEKYKTVSVTLDGRMSKDKRQQSVDRFQNEDKIKVFIGNIKAAGVGLTLTEGEAVIMNDLSFVPADHSQGEDRAYRYGQKNSVLVYYPIFENTIEGLIYDILNQKKQIVATVMGDNMNSADFVEEILNKSSFFNDKDKELIKKEGVVFTNKEICFQIIEKLQPSINDKISPIPKMRDAMRSGWNGSKDLEESQKR